MRLSGDAEGCADAARRLRRAAAEVARTAEALQRAEAAGWTGTAAQGWEGLASRQVRRLREHARSLGAASAAVGRHADALAELQERARRLTAEAADARLLLDRRGDIPPVPLPEPASPELLRDALHRREVRHRLLAAVDELRQQEDRAHARLLGEVQCGRADDLAVRDEEEAGSAWLPNRWDLPAFTVSGSQLAAELRRGLPSVLRSVRGSGVIGAVVGGAVDGFVHEFDLDDILTKNVLVVGAGVLGGVAAGAVSAPVWVPVAAGAAAGYGAGRIFDAHGHRLPWVQHPSERGARRVPQTVRARPETRHRYLPPTPGGRTARHVVHPRPAPAPAPAARSS